MTITLPNNQPHLYQWDTRITLTVPATLTALHTLLHGQPITLAVQDGAVSLPDELLQTPGYLRLWAYRDDHTQDAAAIWVQPRPKPADYVYTPTEIQHFSDLEARISALEQGGGGCSCTGGGESDTLLPLVQSYTTQEEMSKLTFENLNNLTRFSVILEWKWQNEAVKGALWGFSNDGSNVYKDRIVNLTGLSTASGATLVIRGKSLPEIGNLLVESAAVNGGRTVVDGLRLCSLTALTTLTLQFDDPTTKAFPVGTKVTLRGE